jgi:hypothetical protein
MAFNTMGSHLPAGGVDTDSDGVLNMRLLAVMDTVEGLHTGSVLPYIGGPNPEHGLHYTDPARGTDVTLTLQVRDRAIRVSVPLSNRVCVDWLYELRLYMQNYRAFLADAHPSDVFDGEVIRDDGEYGETRYLFTYRSTGPGVDGKTMDFASQYASHIARFLDTLLDSRDGASIEDALQRRQEAEARGDYADRPPD